MEREYSVLVVDDDITLLKMAEELLSEAYIVSVAKSGEQALRLMHKGFCPDIVLMDIDMPEMNGYVTMEKMAQMETVCDVPVLILTGLTQREEEIQGLRSGAEDFITKPFDKEVLFARLTIHIEIGKQRRELRRLRNGSNHVDEEKFRSMAKSLTPTEQKIARLIALGHTNQEIGEELHYSYSYVKKVTGIIFEKAGVKKRNELRKLLK